jgi:uncharacterized lipoprotein NlpE involved in copper resistance
MKDDSNRAFMNILNIDDGRSNIANKLYSIAQGNNTLIGQVINGIKNVINNQQIINNKLDALYSIGQNKQTLYKPIKYLTNRQLYMMIKDGWSIDEISLVSGYDNQQVTDKINQYIQNNT